MNKTFCFAIVALALLCASCHSTIYSGFEKTESGAYMKFYERNASGPMPRLGDGVTIEMAQYFNDTIIMTTAGDAPLELRVEEASFVGDVPDALRMMHIGDSARLVVLSDSLFITMIGMEAPEEYAGKPIYYDLKLLAIKPFEEIEAERKALLDSLMTAEDEYLVEMQANNDYEVTESGLIIMEKKGKGRLAKMGDYIDFDFMIGSKDGDTLISSFDIESMEMQYGEEFIGAGINEALGMVPEGGMMRLVVPSELAFDSVGYEGMILPYQPLVVTLQMNAVMDKAAYEKRQAAIEAEKEAERERKMALESQTIANYIAANGVTVQPTESGLYIIPREEGEGDLAQWGDQVTVHYILSNLKGDQIESSYDIGEPMSFTIGNNEMIPAIEEAVMTMAPGAKVTVISPSELAFGEFEIDKDLLPAYSPLVIELELVSKE